MLAVDWVAVSSIVTAAATLVLAFATFAAVRSSNRSARIAERSLLAGLRPLLAASRPDDLEQKIGFSDDRWYHLGGGEAVAEVTDGNLYLAISIRNVGTGIAVLHGWHFIAEPPSGRGGHPPVERFHHLTRDIYVAPGELGFFQGVIRDQSDPDLAGAREALERRQRVAVDVLYGDHELGQRSVTRFGLVPRDEGGWFASVARHWNVDRPSPR